MEGTEDAVSFPASVYSIVTVIISWRKEEKDSVTAHVQHCSMVVTDGIHL